MNMTRQTIICAVVCLPFYLVNAQLPIKEWTWLHRKIFSPLEQKENSKRKEVVLTKADVTPFTQLMFSWNALRPSPGHFLFLCRTRNARTKEWGKWHCMGAWGHTMQRSFKSDSDALAEYHHVRLEVSPAILADAFSIKIVSEQGADLSLLKSFAVNVADFTLFAPEMAEQVLVPSLLVKGVPCMSQFELDHPRNDGLCSPTSYSMVVSYLLSRFIDPVHFAEKSFDEGLDKYGSWPFNVAHAYEVGNGRVSSAVVRLNSFLNLCNYLKKGIPVVVSVRGVLPGAPRAYHHGHLLVVVGFDSVTKEVICHDPAVATSQEAKKRYYLKNFLQAWERSHRLAYITEPLL